MLERAVRAIVAQAAQALALRRVYLFGSRSRGDARSDSDIDLAFEHDSPRAAWSGFVNHMRDEAPTLLDLDLVDLAQVGNELRVKILKEGRLIDGEPRAGTE
jgi:predicted nucleotidyltransferase